MTTNPTAPQDGGEKLAKIDRADHPIGHVQGHSSDGYGADVGALLRISETDYLWCGEITNDEASEAGCDGIGWWIVHHHGPERTIIGKVAEDYPALDLLDTLAAAIRALQKGPSNG